MSLSFDGRVLAVGGPAFNSSAGATWVFTRDSNNLTYSQMGEKIRGSGAVDGAIGVNQGKRIRSRRNAFYPYFIIVNLVKFFHPTFCRGFSKPESIR